MKNSVVIHDLPPGEAEIVLAGVGQDAYLFPANPPVAHCTGCFGCWTKTPGVCVIKDRHGALQRRMETCEEVVLISRCVYGGFSPAVKRALDRCIGYIQPFFFIDRAMDEMHHLPRYRQAALQVHFWGVGSDRERRTAERLVQANARNFHMQVDAVAFYETAAAIGEVRP